MSILRKIKNALSVCYYSIKGKLLFIRRYDKKYMTGRFFESNKSIGWVWAAKNSKGCKLLGVNPDVRWPVSPRCTVVSPQNITFHPDDLNNFQTFGCYFQGIGKIDIGKGTYIAPNVGLITANHDFNDLDNHLEPKPIILGENCWIGMNSVILPGVTLGDKTIVGAGSVVTKSFPEGNCVIAGSPAKIIKTLS